MQNKYIINWELSLNCNLDCSFCSQKERRNQNRHNLSKKEVFKIIDNLPEKSHISFLGGETFIFPNIINIFKKLEQKGITYEVTTNGILLDILLNKFKNLNNLTQINISIDGYGSTHDISRGYNGLFNNIINIIPELLKIKKINISTVITEAITDRNLLKLYILLNKLGIKEHKIIYLMSFSKIDIINSKNKINELMISSPGNQQDKINTTYKNTFFKKYILLKKLKFNTKVSFEPENIFNKKTSYCKQINKQYRINEKGKLSICEFIDNNFGNLINTNFEIAIKKLKYNNMKNEINKVFPLEICKTCCKNYNI